jgi:transcription elongation factor GreA
LQKGSEKSGFFLFNFKRSGGDRMTKFSYITEDGLLKLKAELEQLVNVERPSISRQIAEARDKGDLSENAEYDAAKDAQGILEMKIAKLEELITSSRIIDETKIDISKVQILNKVKIKNLNTKAVVEYTIVSETEANLKENKLAVSSPIARALLGKKVKDKVDVTVPSGQVSFEILEISR